MGEPKPLDLEAIHLRAEVSGKETTALIAEVKRLRAFLERVIFIPGVERPWCPSRGGNCWWCGADILEAAPRPEPHRDACPWPELAAAVLSWRRG